MPIIPKGTEIKLVAEQDIEAGKVSGLLHFGEKLGFVTDYCVELVPLEEQLQEHLQRHPVISSESFLGKEHFWDLGRRSDISKSRAGTLFRVLINASAQQTTKNALGLTVVRREDVGLPLPPPLDSLRPQTPSQRTGGPDPIYYVVQAQGVVALSKKEGSILSRPDSGVSTQTALETMGSAIELEILSYIQPALFDES